MSSTQHYADTLDEIREAGLFKSERVITSPQSAEITLADGAAQSFGHLSCGSLGGVGQYHGKLLAPKAVH